MTIAYNFTGTSIQCVFAVSEAIDSVYRQAISPAGADCMVALGTEVFG